MNLSKASSIILVNNQNEILMILRDNKTNILYPNCWDLIGGKSENKETPYQTACRECFEEIGIYPPKLHKFMTIKTPYHIEHIYWSFFETDFKTLSCNEGQRLSFLNIEQIKTQNIAFNFAPICNLFLNYIEKFRENAKSN